MIRTEGLTKRFGSVTAVDDVGLDVSAGDIYGFLGANGSGKTTTVRCRPRPRPRDTGIGSRCSASRCPCRTRTCCPRWGRSSRDPPPTGICPGRPTSSSSTPAAGIPRGAHGGGRRDRADRARRALEVVGLGDVGGDRSARTPSACVSGSAWRPPCCANPSCSSSTSRRTALTRKGSARSGPSSSSCTRRARRSSCPATCWPRSTSSAPGSGSSTAAAWSSRSPCPRCGRPTGRTVVETSDVALAKEVLGRPASSAREGERLVIRSADPARVNARLVAAGVAVRELGPERRTLEQVIEERTSARRPGRSPGDAGRAGQAVRAAPHLGRDRPAQPAADPGLRAAGVDPDRPAPGTGAGVPVGGHRQRVAVRASPRWPSCCRCSCRSRSPSWPGDAVAGEAQAGTLRYLLVRPVGRTRLLVAKLVAVVVFVLVGVVSVTVIGFVVGHFLLGDAPLSQAMVSISGSVLTPGQVAWRTVAAVLLVTFSMLGVAAMALFLSTTTDSPLSATLGALAFLIGSSLLLTIDAAQPLQPYLPTRYWLSFVDLYRDPILWSNVSRGIALQAVYLGVLLLGAPGRTSRPATSRAEPARSRRAPRSGSVRFPAPRRPWPERLGRSAARRGSPGWPRRRSAPTGWARRPRPSEVGGCTTSSLVVHSDSPSTPVGSGSPSRRESTGLSGASCWHAVGQVPDTRVPSRATSVPCSGDPSMTSRRILPGPSPSVAQSRATTPPAEYPTTSTDRAPVRARTWAAVVPSASDLGGQVSLGPVRQVDHGDVPAGLAQSGREALERGGRAAVPRDQQHRTGGALVDRRDQPTAQSGEGDDTHDHGERHEHAPRRPARTAAAPATAGPVARARPIMRDSLVPHPCDRPTRRSPARPGARFVRLGLVSVRV